MKPEVYIAVISLFVSIFALQNSVDESKKTSEYNRESLLIAKEMNKQTAENYRLAVKPMLSFSTNLTPSDPTFDFIGVQVDNRGIGPALFTPPLLIYDGKPLGLLEPSNSQFIKRELKIPDNIFLLQVHGSLTLPPGDKRKVIWSEKKDSASTTKYLTELIQHLDIVFCYTSIYEEDHMFNALKGLENLLWVINEQSKWFPGQITMTVVDK